MKLNYEFGEVEAVSLIELPAFTLNDKTGIKLDGIYSFAMDTPVLYSDSLGTTPIPLSARTLEIDTAYTEAESEDGGTNQTVYKSITIIDNSYAGIPLYISGNNYGSYTDNEAVQTQINQILEGTAQYKVADAIVRNGTDDRGDGFLYADGRAISRSVYAILFDEIGTTFGVGDGSTTFNIPDQTDYPTPLDTTLKWHIKAESILPSTGEVASADIYPSGWLSVPSSGNSILVTHGLNDGFEGLVKVLSVRDGLGNESSDVLYVDGLRAGLVLRPNNSNSLYVQAGDGGVIGVKSDGTAFTATEFNITVIKPNLIATYNYAPDIVEIPDGVNVSKAFPELSTINNEITVGRRGSGAGTMTFNTPNGENIRWPDGATTTSMLFEGGGSAILKPVGGEYYVVDFNDSGNTGTAFWNKKADGTMEQRDQGVSLSNGGTYTLVKPFIDANYVPNCVIAENGSKHIWAHTRTTTQFNTRVLDNNNNAVSTTEGTIIVVGRWRT